MRKIVTATTAAMLGVLAGPSASLAWCILGFGRCSVPGPTAAPEIDPGTITAAVTLLSGGIMLLVDRRRRRR